MESIIETIRGAIKSTINFIKNKMFKLKTYRDLLASFIHLIFSALAYVIVYWGAFISGTVIFTWALITVLEIIIKEGTSNVINTFVHRNKNVYIALAITATVAVSFHSQ